MKSTRTLLATLGAALLLGLAAGLTVAGPSAGADPPATTSTDAGTTSTPQDTTTTTPATTDATSTTTTPTTTDATSTTTTTTPPPTTTTESTTAPTTTVGSTTTSTTAQPPVEQTTTQQSAPPPPPTTTAAPPPPTTTAPCDTTAITCGNNAATQLAIVSQTCNANSANAIIDVHVTTLDGTPVNNVTINPQTSCMNVLAITQVVHQYCVACTVIVVPPPTVVNVVNPPGPSAPAPAPTVERVMGYCTQNGLEYLDEGQPMWDPTYAKAFPASYVTGVGMTCPDANAQPTVPMFTLTVPASLVGQYLNLCLQPGDPRVKPTCHAVRIDAGATVSIPVSTNVKATVTAVKGATKTKAHPKPKPKRKKPKPKNVGKASNAIAAAAIVHHTVPKGARR